mmetsp:Transcript_33999/g.109579  ORF Transcript_33999/g.109579 Transcript_33999/m.109579 type:complete len:332 (+) Transcript_33999:428-1423(+)
MIRLSHIARICSTPSPKLSTRVRSCAGTLRAGALGLATCAALGRRRAPPALPLATTVLQKPHCQQPPRRRQPGGERPREHGGKHGAQRRLDCERRGGGKGEAGEGEGGAADAHCRLVRLEEVGSEGASVGPHAREELPPRARPRARLGGAHRGQRRSRGVRRPETVDAEVGDGARRDRRHLQVAAVVGQGERARRQLRPRRHHTRPHDGVVHAASTHQALALVVPRLCHPAEAVEQDGKERPRRLALPGNAHDPLARAAAGGSREERLHPLVVDILGVGRVVRRVAPKVGQLACASSAVRRDHRVTADEEVPQRCGVVDVAADGLDARKPD